MKKVQILHHLAMGDHILCNGLIRSLLDQYEELELFSSEMHFDAVSWMYRDEDRIQITPVRDANEARKNFTNDCRHLILGFEKLQLAGFHFDHAVYKLANIDFSARWNRFYYERDRDSEIDLFERYAVEPHSYIVIHEDPVRNFLIDRSSLPRNKKHIFIKPLKNRQGKSVRIFDFLSLLENAAEIHCIDSSFRCLIESFSSFEEKGLYFHDYARDNSELMNISEKWEWRRVTPNPKYYRLLSFMKPRAWMLFRLNRIKLKVKGRLSI